MSKTLYLSSFITGILVGTAATWYYLKDKYERIAREEIDSVKAVFEKKETDKEPENKAVKKDDDGIMAYYKDKVSEYGYSNYGRVDKPDKTEKAPGPYIISPEEFGHFEDYETISLTYYSDGVLADEEDEIIGIIADNEDENVGDFETLVGKDFMDHFGEYEEDSVFVRNDERCCDYEILRDMHPYLIN